MTNTHWRKKPILIRCIIFLGIIVQIAGLVFFFLSLHLGTQMRDYTRKSSKEYDIVDVTAIALDSKDNVYCLSDALSAVNVFSADGVFKYSLAVPDYQNGSCSLYIKNDVLFIQDKNYDIYYYKYGTFKGRVSCDQTIKQYDEKDKLLYSISYPNDGYSYFPIYVNGDFLYVSNSNNQLMTYKNGSLISKKLGDENDLSIIYAGNKTMDQDRNIYCMKGIIPSLVKISPTGDSTTIATISFWNWLRQTPFACLAIAVVGAALTAIFIKL